MTEGGRDLQLKKIVGKKLTDPSFDLGEVDRGREGFDGWDRNKEMQSPTARGEHTTARTGQEAKKTVHAGERLGTRVRTVISPKLVRKVRE